MKSDMWAGVARDLGVPWRTAEAMHWILGEQEMARRAGVTPFAMAGAPVSDPSLSGGGLLGNPTSPRGSERGAGPEGRISENEAGGEGRRRRSRGEGVGGGGGGEQGHVLPSLWELEVVGGPPYQRSFREEEEERERRRR